MIPDVVCNRQRHQSSYYKYSQRIEENYVQKIKGKYDDNNSSHQSTLNKEIQTIKKESNGNSKVINYNNWTQQI